MDIPAPTDAASPTTKVVHVSCVANAVAKIGASVETEPSINPANPGCTHVKTNCLFAVLASISFVSPATCFSIRLSAATV